MIRLKLCVFPNDPIKSYYEKGEIKKRYFNPDNIFEEIHIISFTEDDVKEEKVKEIAGNARLIIHSLGHVNLKNRKKQLKVIKKIVSDIKPDVIRTFNPLIQGWCAAKCAIDLKIPLFVSLHTQYDQNRKILKKTNFKKFLLLKYTEKMIEPFVLKHANVITAVFRIIEPYVQKHTKTKPIILHNKINLKQFEKAKGNESLPKNLIISVGRLNQEKNHQCIIEAIKDLDVNLLIIGNGEMYKELVQLIEKLGIQDKVTIIKKVENQKIAQYYKAAKIFALAYNPKQEGLPIPVIEAMAANLPIVISKPEEEFSEGLENCVIFSERTPVDFKKNICKLLNDNELQEKILKNLKVKVEEFDEKILEKKESKIYSDIMKNFNPT